MKFLLQLNNNFLKVNQFTKFLNLFHYTLEFYCEKTIEGK